MGRRSKYPEEFREQAVAMVRDNPDRALAEVARDLGVNDSTLSNWVNRARIDAGEGRPEELSTSEREELVKLRRENARLKMEREILKKAAAFFVQESTR
ncbi:MAG: transposase [Frankiaceae bacterium]|nr:transposase [Frankiaceae bacterium]